MSLEGVWGAGKSTVCRELAERLTKRGLRVRAMHYGSRDGIMGMLSAYLDSDPLRVRVGLGGFVRPYHVTVDVLLRLCREAHDHQRIFSPPLATHDVVVLDRCIDTIWAYCLAILIEREPDVDPRQHLRWLMRCSEIWALRPDRTFFIDTPWPLARERANKRGTPQSLERLLFMPLLEIAWRVLYEVENRRIYRVLTYGRDISGIVDEVENEVLRMLEMSVEEVSM